MAGYDGGPAFPRPASQGLGGFSEQASWGMSLRDWFAGQVLAGIAGTRLPADGAEEVARIAYETANAMLEARSDDDS